MKPVLKLLICLFIGIAITACDNDVPKDNTELISMWVSSETTIVYDEWLDADMECMLVKFNPDSNWQPMNLGKIQGFSYEKGVEYELSVYRSTPIDGPGAGENFAYRLYKIIRKTEKRVVVEGLEQYYTIPYEGGEIEAHFTSNIPYSMMEVLGSVDYGSEVTIDKEAEGKYVIRFSAERNTGMGRVKTVKLHFQNGEMLTIGLWQNPRPFGKREKFVLSDEGCLGSLLGEEYYIGDLTEITIKGYINANDAFYLKKIIDNAGSSLPQGERKISVNLAYSSFSSGTKSYYSDCGICDLPKELLPVVHNNEVSKGVFTGNKYISEVRLSENIKAIGNSAFSHCPQLKKVNIPAACKIIYAYAFYSCTSLEEVEFPYIHNEFGWPSFEKIEESAFSGIGRLKSFVLPESLKSVATTALSFYVDKLFSLTEEPPVWEVPGNAGYVVGPKPDGCTLYVPYGCSEAYKESEKWGKFKIEEMPEENWWEI
jgi:hypothetical protein